MPFQRPKEDGSFAFPEAPMQDNLNGHHSDEKKSSLTSQPPPPAYSTQPPPAGIRIPCSTHQAFPEMGICGLPPFQDLNGQPVFVASCIRSGSVHPCKAAPHLPGVVRLSYGGAEIGHEGRYDILPVTDQMEWVQASAGLVPNGRRPVEGGYEEMGQHLFHAAAWIGKIKVPGKAGQHLGGARFPFNGQEHSKSDDYEILCWR